MARIVQERSDVIPLLSEVFREFGYEGTSLSAITAHTGLGKGSLYHFFPGGKKEMADAVLVEIDQWFERHIFVPLQEASNSREAIESMLVAVDDYFQSGGRICLVGAFALSNTRDLFARRISSYFDQWIISVDTALQQGGIDAKTSLSLAEEFIGSIQGALLLARGVKDQQIFARTLTRLHHRLDDLSFS